MWPEFFDTRRRSASKVITVSPDIYTTTRRNRNSFLALIPQAAVSRDIHRRRPDRPASMSFQSFLAFLDFLAGNRPISARREQIPLQPCSVCTNLVICSRMKGMRPLPIRFRSTRVGKIRLRQ